MDLSACYRGKKVLVTGDTGFKGSWLVSWLLRHGADVVGFALPASSTADNFVVCDLATRITHIDGDVREHERVAALITTHRPEIVFHLAAQSLVIESFATPRATFETNIMGTVNVLDAARHSPSVRAIVICTSDKCYAQLGATSAFRETDALGGDDPYSASKGATEIVTASMRHSFFQRAGAAAVATVRAGNVIGGGDWAANRILPDCIRALRTGQPIIVRNPHAVRPWQHVLDALHGYLMLGAKLLDGDARFASAWNFGPADESTVSVDQVVTAVIDTWGSGSQRVQVAEGAVPEARVLRLDSSRAHELLGWRPALEVKRAIALTVEGYRSESGTPAQVFAHRLQQILTYEGLVRG